MRYFQALCGGFDIHTVFVRSESREEAGKVFELFKRVHSGAARGTLIPISRWEGWRRFRSAPVGCHMRWEESDAQMDVDFQRFASRNELAHQDLVVNCPKVTPDKA